MRSERTVVSAGVNPGFVMDLLPVFLCGAVFHPKTLHARRSVDLSRRRSRLREKLGVGMNVEAWEAAGGARTFGHVGLVESAHLCAAGLGWEPLESSFSRESIVSAGSVVGVREAARLTAAGGRTVSLDLEFKLGAKDEDSIDLDADPPLHICATGGVHGDSATVARILHATRHVKRMASGLRLPVEVPLPVKSPPFPILEQRGAPSA
jgi:hypothetical protein